MIPDLQVATIFGRVIVKTCFSVVYMMNYLSELLIIIFLVIFIINYDDATPHHGESTSFFGVDSSKVDREKRQVSRGCLLPSYPENGKWEVQSDYVGWKPGEKVDTDTFLKFSCNYQHKMSGRSHILCTANGWSEIPPTCVAICFPLFNTSAMRVTCYNSDQPDRHNILCYEAEFGAIAEFEYPPYSESSSEKVVQKRYCRDHGWLDDPQ